MSGQRHDPDRQDPSTLEALATLERALTEEGSLDELVRPLLGLVGAMTGLDVVFLTEVFLDAPVAAQEVLIVDGDGAGIDVEEGQVVAWQDTLCRRCLAEQSGLLTDVGASWGLAPAANAIATYVSVPIRLPGSVDVGATLCGASTTHVTLDDHQHAAMRLVARLVGAALWQRRTERLAHQRAEDAERRLAARLTFDAKMQNALWTPLSVVRGWAITLRDERLDDPRLRREGLQVIERTADRMLRQVGQLLRKDRILAAGAAPDDVDVRAVVDDALGLLQGRPVAVTGDATLLGDQAGVAVVVKHLLENVAAHTPDGTRVRVLIERDPPDVPRPDVVLVVEDDGPGLPDRDDLFDAFVSADPTAARHGSGLGLHIVREIAEKWGGSITAGATAGGGARFELRVPVRPPVAGPPLQPDVGASVVPLGNDEA